MIKLNVKKLRENKKTTIISSKEALRDVTPINWAQDVIDGKKKVEIKAAAN